MNGGTWTFAGTGNQFTFPGQEGRLNGVTAKNELVLDQANGRARISAGTSVPAARLAAANTSVGVPPGTILGFDVTFEGTDSGIRALELNGAAGSLVIPAGRTIRSTPGSVCHGLIGPLWFGGDMTLTVEGAIVCAAVNRGIAVNPAVLTNYDGATRTLVGETWTANNGLISFGSAGSPIERYNADITVSGAGGNFESLKTSTLRANLGTLRLDNNRDVTIHLDGQSFTNSGTLRLGPGCTLTLSNGPYSQTRASTLWIELGGDSAMTGFGRLIAQQTATLADEMRARYVNGFVPVCGQLFGFFNAAMRIGGWDTFDLPTGDDETAVIVFYDGGSALLRVTSTADFNRDGFLNGLDFDEFVVAFEAGDPSADFDQDGFITGIDFDEFVVRFEAGC